MDQTWTILIITAFVVQAIWGALIYYGFKHLK